MNIKATYNHALLAEAAYANLWDKDSHSVFTSDKKIEGALTRNGFSKTQAEEFVKDWEVVSHQANTASGFSATLFKNKHTQ